MKILVVDDHPLIREGLQTLISHESNMECIGIVGNSSKALEIVENKTPDIVTVDLRLGQESGFDVINKVNKILPSCKSIILTSSVNPDDLRKAMEVEAYGYVLKEALPEELLYAINLVYSGRKFFDPEMLEIMMKQNNKGKERLIEDLTPKEMEVLSKLGLGQSNKEIAKNLFISENTVKKHVSQILDKLHLSDRTQAALFANAKGLATYELV